MQNPIRPTRDAPGAVGGGDGVVDDLVVVEPGDRPLAGLAVRGSQRLPRERFHGDDPPIVLGCEAGDQVVEQRPQPPQIGQHDEAASRFAGRLGQLGGRTRGQGDAHGAVLPGRLTRRRGAGSGPTARSAGRATDRDPHRERADDDPAVDLEPVGGEGGHLAVLLLQVVGPWRFARTSAASSSSNTQTTTFSTLVVVALGHPRGGQPRSAVVDVAVGELEGVAVGIAIVERVDGRR